MSGLCDLLRRTTRWNSLGRERHKTFVIFEKTLFLDGNPYHDLIEEYQSEDVIGSPPRSINHSRLIHRISVALDRYDDRYDVLPELELELSTGKCKPDICVYANLSVDWLNDVIFYSHPSSPSKFFPPDRPSPN